MKKLLAAILAIAFIVMSLPIVGAKPERERPIAAVEIELVKKSTAPQASAKGKPSDGAATGVLGAPVTGIRYAIIIGISNYPGTRNDLKYADDDAGDMFTALTTLYGFDAGNIRLLKDLNATFEAIRAAVVEIRSKAVAGDEVVFFFSGHGAKGKADDGDEELVDEAIVCHDGSSLVYIWDGQLKIWFSDFATSRIVFIFDSCLSGGMTDLKASGRVIAMACSETGSAYEGDAWQNGQFTYYFVDKGMIQGLADKYDHDNDGVRPEGIDVVVEEAFDYAKANCQNQKPVISDSFANDLLL